MPGEVLKMTNEDFVSHIQQGESNLMSQLYEKNIGMIKKVSYSMAKDEEEYSDLTQEAYFALIATVKKFDISKGYKFITYFTRVLKWQFMRYKTQHKNNELLTLNSSIKEDSELEQIDLISDDNAVDPQDSIETKDFILRTRNELDKLSENERVAVYLQLGHRVNYSVIGERLGISAQELSSILRQAKSKIRRNYKAKKIFNDWVGQRFYQNIYKSNGFQMFKNTFESNVERLVIQKYEYENKLFKVR